MSADDQRELMMVRVESKRHALNVVLCIIGHGGSHVRAIEGLRGLG